MVPFKTSVLTNAVPILAFRALTRSPRFISKGKHEGVRLKSQDHIDYGQIAFMSNFWLFICHEAVVCSLAMESIYDCAAFVRGHIKLLRFPSPQERRGFACGVVLTLDGTVSLHS